jgi:glycosyltransferase involved in cell wall biosynthesis
MIEVAGNVGIGVNAYDIESIANGIYTIINDTQLAKSESEKGLKRAAEFTWEKTAKQTLEVYRKVGNKDIR